MYMVVKGPFKYLMISRMGGGNQMITVDHTVGRGSIEGVETDHAQ